MELSFPLILDGATGTQLQKRGYTGDECPESWTLNNPQAILDIQRSYVEAGSRVIYAPHFRSQPGQAGTARYFRQGGGV